MSSPLPAGMMRTFGGVRIAARPDPDQHVVLSVQGITTAMTIDQSHQLRDILQAAELDAARGNVIT